MGDPARPVTPVAEQLAALAADAADIVPEDALREKLELGRPLRVKLGLDPTAPAVTLGWAVVLRRLRRFQDLGHIAVLIVGDYTARVGDPSGRSEMRRQLSKEEVDGYADRLLAQFRTVLSDERLEIRRNSEWLEDMRMDDVLGLTASTTVAQMLQRDDFAQRHAAGAPISLMEFMYPLLQAYDSVAVRADVELGGTDQLFNLLVGRQLQRDHDQDPQLALTMPLLEGLDGVQKMSQSLGNYVGIDEPAEEQFGKLMSIPDHLIVKYLRLCTAMPAEEVDAVERGLGDGSLRPNDQKRRMARLVVHLYHGDGAAAQAESRFDLLHKEHRVPDDVPELAIPEEARRGSVVWLPRLLVAAGLASSNAEARRAVQGGGVRLDGAVLDDPQAEFEADALRGKILAVGRRRFVRLV
ncbi:MAG TPA: tyrosine--tRNA ligase [Actinomycetota bacterium]|nr:tyrosine--tRNA ligase [Actinomycetota bacterium]